MLTGTIVISDDKKKKSSVKVYLAPATTLANATTLLQTLSDRIKLVITGKIESIQLSADITVPPASVGSAAATADVEEKGRFIFNTAAGKKMRVSIPTWDESTVLGGTDVIDVTDANVDNVIAWFLNGAPVKDSNDQVLGSLDRAYEVFE